jgi:hypothetical protein
MANKIEKRTLIIDEPRIGSGHVNIDPALLDPKIVTEPNETQISSTVESDNNK